MATFYFNNAAVDGDWSTLGNWWMVYDAGTNTFSVPATNLPTSADDVVAFESIFTNTSTDPVVGSLTMNGSASFNISITVTGNATFNYYSHNNYGTITIFGNCIFNNFSYNFYSYVYGDAIFNNNSSNYYGYCDNAHFNDDSFNWNGSFGIVSFNGFSGIKLDPLYANSVKRFYKGEENSSLSFTFYYNSLSPKTQQLTYTYYSTDWGDTGNWWLDQNCTTPAYSLPTEIDDVVFLPGSQCLSNSSNNSITVKSLILLGES